MAGWIWNTQAVQCFHGNGHHTQSFAWLPEFPARDGNKTIRFKMLEVLLECLGGIEITFSQSHGARGCGSPRINKRHLHDVELLRGAADERSAVGYHDVYLGKAVEAEAVIRVA